MGLRVTDPVRPASRPSQGRKGSEIPSTIAVPAATRQRKRPEPEVDAEDVRPPSPTPASIKAGASAAGASGHLRRQVCLRAPSSKCARQRKRCLTALLVQHLRTRANQAAFLGRERQTTLASIQTRNPRPRMSWDLTIRDAPHFGHWSVRFHSRTPPVTAASYWEAARDFHEPGLSSIHSQEARRRRA